MSEQEVLANQIESIAKTYCFDHHVSTLMRAAALLRQQSRECHARTDDHEMFLNILGDMMSNLSELCFCAGWIDGMEDALPWLCERAVRLRAAQPWGQHKISVQSAKWCLRLAELAGSWVNYNMDEGPEYIPYTPKEIKI